jgi:adenine-specific DNA-methyltransferase
MPKKSTKPASPKKTKPTSAASVEAYAHETESRPNIPTAELSAFAKDDEKRPKKIRYAYDPSLSPQLLWAGKQEQDEHGLDTLAVPIYIQEKIAPEALIEALKDEPAQQDLFADFNGITFDKLVEFYQHSQHWTNRMILGDSLLVMTSLAEKERLRGKVQMIYLDPPYGIKFGSNWQSSTRKRDVKDGNPADFTRQPEQLKAFRDTWQLGIHSYLSYLRDRLTVARDLLTESGSCFVQIGDENVHLVRSVMDEVFGSENFCKLIAFRTTAGDTSNLLPTMGDYIVWYAKNRVEVKFRKVLIEKEIGFGAGEMFDSLESPLGDIRKMTEEEIKNPNRIPQGWRAFRIDNLKRLGFSSTATINFNFCGKVFHPKSTHQWKTNFDGLERLRKADWLIATKETLSYKRYFDDFPVTELGNIWTDTQGASDKTYVVQTSTKVIERCMLMTTDVGDLVLDPTCGSGTTAVVAEEWGRRWITIDTSRVALALARTRLMTAKYPYYKPKAADSSLSEGFIYKEVPHITLKSIANNAEIDVIHARYEPELERLRAEYNRLTAQALNSWELPRPSAPNFAESESSVADEALKAYWSLWQRRQAEMNESIRAAAEMETLYDQPEEDKKRIRVTGAFTVESLSPHRVLETAEGEPLPGEPNVEETRDFIQMALENLKRAGVQNTVKGERLKFERLEPYSGKFLHAEGEYLTSSARLALTSSARLALTSSENPNEEQGALKRVAVCIGPELGTVSAELVREAAKEAVKFFDVLVVCGFAFEASVGEETAALGRLTVLKAKMNPDLQMGEDLLKKTGGGNLFVVFGEPDIAIRKLNDGKLEAEVRGVDVYDPTTGEVRSNNVDEVACWFIDTNYNGESFFVRHAYFTGAGDPYEKLKRALKAEISEEKWAQLYRTVSMPFEKPKTGKIAVKVINHYGDEVMKVYEI